MNSSEEKLCLKWNDFQENVISEFGKLRNDQDFADVTLACEDGEQVEAHKVILLTASPFFQNLLRRNKHQHPLIYMRGVKSEDLVAIVDFLYYGETNVYQENLDSFLALAEELKLKGLSGKQQNQEEIKDPTEVEMKPEAVPKREPKNKKMQTKMANVNESQDAGESPREGVVALNDSTVVADLEGLDEQIKAMMEISENALGGAYGNLKARACKVCGKEGKDFDIRRHIESNHITGVSHSCNVCGKTSRSRHALRVHMSSYHK